ncbi:tetratricopeptide repeat protein [Nioella ostreopsis]|jgi:TPR repeat protein|uniref:tetratricopeptide repeat protein n=1 Tax=Nioella ostreopsis TaxID=2448479 RepID=UPI000FDC8B73|nr:tetratricopeptide repeat protein [Nioella ostreopsis]
MSHFRLVFPRALILAAGLALALPLTAAAQSHMTSTYGDISVTITGSGSISSRETARGIEAVLNEHTVLITNSSVVVDGQVYNVQPEAQVVVDGNDGFAVMVDGVDVMMIAEIAGLTARAEAGEASAQLDLGMIYWDGEGVEQDYVRAVQLFRQAAEQGNAIAQSNLAYAYYNAEGVENDDNAAMYWAGLSAAQGDEVAMRLVAFGHYRGRGFPENRAEAARIWAEAANLGDDYSAYNMGIIIRDGDGVQQDDALAILWFERAQELGHPDAAERLEEMRAQ